MNAPLQRFKLVGTVNARYIYQALLLIAITVALFPGSAMATGTPDLQAPGDAPVMLLVGDGNFGDFASYGAPETNQLRVRVNEAGETVYFGFARAYNYDGTPKTTGAFYYRVRRLSDDQIVHGPILVNTQSANLSTYDDAVMGPGELTPGGYYTDNDFKFTALTAGDYAVEFSSQLRYLGLWDITVGSNGVEQSGRVYSQNWAFRVPVADPVLPDCVWGAELNSRFYSYTADGFVTQIDFADSGFQPLSFNLAFNRTGPGETGDLQLDRMSISNVNATAAGAEHFIFIESPDPAAFPDGSCGDVVVDDQFQCSGDGFCIPVSVSVAGQVEVVLDFNNNQLFDDGVDRVLVYTFEEGAPLETCLFWDGLRGDGNAPDDGQTVNLLVNYTQGVQHWALYDGEKMSEGFCVTPIRPICGDGGNAKLYYDDRNIQEASGTSSVNDGRQGCDCATADCRTWTNFDAATNDCSDIDDQATSGYGDKNTLNTWWFASSRTQVSLDVPISLAVISGPADFCPGDQVMLSAEYFSAQPAVEILWSGPNDFAMSGSLEVLASDPGIYSVAITDELGCSTTASFALMGVNCTINTEIVSINCNNNGTDTDGADDYFTAEVIVNGSNSTGWMSPNSSLSGEYGATIVLGPFPIAEGDVSIMIADNDYACCMTELLLLAPESCSDGCSISQTLIGNNICDDNDTPADPTDDTYTFTVNLDGYNLSEGWISSIGTTGSYGTPEPFGPYPIADGIQVIGFSDLGDAECTVTVTVTPVNTCSDLCIFEAAANNIYCDDNGTEFDPLDDLYYFDLDVTSVNGTNNAYEIEGAGIGLYGLTQQMGPYSIADGEIEITITDIVDASCVQTISVSPPASCSDLCGIKVQYTSANCGDNGTPEDFTDDLFYYEILVNSLSASNTTWVANDGTTGEYGVPTQSVFYSEVNSQLEIIVTDATNPTCSDTALVEVPLPELRCPDDVELMINTDVAITHITGGLVNVRNYFEPEDDLSCWLDETALVPGGRFYDRFTIQCDAPIEAGPQLYTFYLFEENIDTATIGAVFRLSEEEDIDCCNLVNPGPIPYWNPEELTEPYLTDSLYPEDMELVQQFTLLLQPQEDYTVVTTTWSMDTFGNYQWVIVAGNEAEINSESNNINYWQEEDASAAYNLYTFHLDEILNELGGFERPGIIGGCGTAELSSRDTVITQDCEGAELIRAYDFAFQDSVIMDACSQTFFLDHLSIDDVVFPQQAYQFTCTDTFPMLENGNPDPDYTGHPAVNDMGTTIILDDNIGYEGIIATYFDRDSLRPDGGRNIYREWIVVDQCDMVDTTYTQLFKLEIAGTPDLACPLTNHYCPILGEDIMVFTTEQFDCFADIEIPLPDLINICDPGIWTITSRVYRVDTLEDGTVDTVDLLFLEPGDDRLWLNVETNDYFIEYIGIHPEEDTLYQTCRFRVADLNEPVPICRGNVNISLPGSGIYRLFTNHVDQGSYDNCDDFTLDIRRSYINDPESCLPLDSLTWSDWSNFVDFNCCDVGDELIVQLRIRDQGGNTNFCETTVNVFDYTLPICTGLETETISCDDLPGDFAPGDTLSLRQIFGMPDVIDNCSAYALELPPIIMGDACAPEQIIRRFQAVDQHGNLASSLFTQTIFVTPSLNYAIHFPQDTETDCVTNMDTLRVEMAGCDNIEITFTDELLPTSGEECRRIARTYVVTNLCEWDGVSPAVTVSRDIDCDGTEGDQDIWVLRRNDTTFYDVDSLEYNNLPAIGTSNCPEGTNPEGYWSIVSSTGRWTYTQIILVMDNTPPSIAVVYNDSICTDSLACIQNILMDVTVFDACVVQQGGITFLVDLDSDGTFDESFADFDPQVTGTFPAYTFNHVLPIGNHVIRVVANDDCGNSATENYPVNVFDCYVPELQCLDYEIYNLEDLGVPTDIDNDGELEEAAAFIDATELGNCLFEDCSGELIYTINRPGDLPGLDLTGIYLDCNDRYMVDLEVYVWDNANNPFSVQPDGSIGGRNWRMCNLTVLLQDPDQACSSCTDEENLVTIGGAALGEQQQFLSGVVVEVLETNDVSGTNGNGRFTFLVESGSDYTVKASKNDDVPAGISTVDMLLLQAHLLDQLPITDPYQLIAADINADGEINIFDLLLLQMVVIGTSDEFPGNTSWVFVPADWNGEGSVPQGISYQTLQSCAFDAMLKGIKVGDLNGSIAPQTSSFARQAISPKEATLEMIRVQDRALSAGMVIKVAVPMPSASRFFGGQLSLNWNTDALNYQAFEGIQIGAENVNDRSVDMGQLAFNYAASTLARNELVLEFVVLQDGLLSDWINIDQQGYFANELYRVNTHSPQPVALGWKRASEANDASLSNTTAAVSTINEESGLTTAIFSPNPILDLARLSVLASHAGEAQLTITDMSGRVVLKRTIKLFTGSNLIDLDARDWRAGAYAYALELDEQLLQGVVLKR